MRINYICAMTIVLLKIQSDQNSSENLYLSWRGNHPLIDWKPTMMKTTNNPDLKYSRYTAVSILNLS